MPGGSMVGPTRRDNSVNDAPTPDEIASYLADFYQGSRIDWDDALSRAEMHFDIDLPTSMMDPQIKDIQRAYRAELKARNE
jgi:hypothetical protein